MNSCCFSNLAYQLESNKLFCSPLQAVRSLMLGFHIKTICKNPEKVEYVAYTKGTMARAASVLTLFR